MMNKYRLLLIVAFVFPIESYSAIRDHIPLIQQLQNNHDDAQIHIKKFSILLKQAQERVRILTKLHNNYEKKLPEYSYFRDETHFSFYKNDILVYDTHRGTGIKIDEEKLYIKENHVEYTDQGKLQYKKYKHLSGELIEELAIPQYIFWKRGKRSGFKKISEEGKRLYRYSYDEETKSSRLNLKEDCFFERVNSEKISHIQINKLEAIKIREYSTTYYKNPKVFYTLFVDGNISLSKYLKKKAFYLNQKQSEHIWKDLIKDCENTLYYQYFKQFVINKKLNSKQIYLNLINNLRREYHLKAMQHSNKLDRLCSNHSKYLVRHQPTGNIHEEYHKRKGFTGETAFVRRKKIGYPYRVKEWITFGGDPIYNFIKLLEKPEWLYVLLHPHAVSIGYDQEYCFDGVEKNILETLLISYKNQESKKFPLIQYPLIQASKYQLKKIVEEKKAFCKSPDIDYIKTERSHKFLLLFMSANNLKKSLELINPDYHIEDNYINVPLYFKKKLVLYSKRRRYNYNLNKLKIVDFSFQPFFMGRSSK